ncbi:MAG: M20/M25/M40 family metallo-hydrolase [Acidobacteria bacterium]|nr:M20/M25/M40 family metallo-hydrolase [Acidobacteriota bacterium]
MRRLSHVAVLSLLLAGLAVAATPPIAADALLGHIKVLAADELRGRANGSEGLERAGDYIAAQFKAAGLRPGGRDDGWFQPFELIAGLDVGRGNALAVRAHGRDVRLSLGTSYYPLSVAPSDSPDRPSVDLKDVPLVFAGYGISAPSARYDDYAGLDVAGKAVLIFSHEPQENRRDSRLNGAQPLRETTLYAKAQAARTRGARALLVVSDPTHRIDQADYALFTIEADADDHGIPVLRVARAQMQPLLQAWDLDGVAAEIDRDLVPRSRALTGATIEYTEVLSLKRRTVRNVVGILPGSDASRAGEAVVLGAHYDHVGLGGRYSSSPEQTGEIHNGADDNASGVAALIEIARAGAADPSRFPRSLVFVAFAGEERGLFGSAHYAANPAMSIANTVAMINLDMVGRSNGRVEVAGLNEAPSLAADVDAAAKAAGGIEVRRGGPGAGRSDDSSFVDKNVPSLHLFTGFHDDYHRPSDDWSRIDAPGTARVATLALELAARIAARADRPRFLNR